MSETSTPEATQNAENTRALSAVAYILTWITGLIMFLVSKDKGVRWHAIQAIGLGIAFFAISIILTILTAALATTGAVTVLGLLNVLFWIGAIVLIIILAVKAYQGNQVRLPVIAAFADKHA